MKKQTFYYDISVKMLKVFLSRLADTIKCADAAFNTPNIKQKKKLLAPTLHDSVSWIYCWSFHDYTFSDAREIFAFSAETNSSTHAPRFMITSYIPETEKT